jgi:hypothetical protein
VWSGVQQLLLSFATQVLDAQCKPVVMCFTFMPAEQAVIVEQDALAVQQSAMVLPTVPYFAESLKCVAGQFGLAALHLVESSTQQVASSEEAHVEVAQ